MGVKERQLTAFIIVVEALLFMLSVIIILLFLSG